MADLRRCLVAISVAGVTFEGGVSLGAGQVVDLDQSIGGGRALRDCVDEVWFDVVDPPASSTRHGAAPPATVRELTRESTDGD